MKLIIFIINSLSLILLVQSCKDQNTVEFFAGKTDNIIYSKLNPEIVFPIGEKTDSVDINMDSKYELIFKTIGIPGASGFFIIPTVRGTKDLNILLGGDRNMPKALSKDEIICTCDKWSITDSLIALYYYEDSQNPHVIGYWKDQQDKYLGFKYKNKLGWIKITTTINTGMNQSLILKESGIEENK